MGSMRDGMYCRDPTWAAYVISVRPPLPLSMRVSRSLGTLNTALVADPGTIAVKPVLNGRAGSWYPRHPHGTSDDSAAPAILVGVGTVHAPKLDVDPGLIRRARALCLAPLASR